MAEKNKVISETFGKYAQSSVGKNSKVDGPKNVTSDMWTPISGGRSDEEKAKAAEKPPQKKATPPAQKKTPQKKAPSGKNDKKPRQLISEGGKKETENKNSKTTQARKKKNSQKSRVPKGRPISELGEERVNKYKSAEKVRNQQKLSKAERDYDDGIKGGKSPGELSKERAGYKRKRRVRQNVIIITVFLVFALAFAGIYTYSKGAPVGVITVKGDSIYSSEEIVTAAGLETGVNMLSVKEAEVSARVCSALPYIHNVQVKRKLPDELILTVTPTRERYLFANEDECVAVDDYGKVLADGEGMKLTEGLYRVYGIEWDSCTAGASFVPAEKSAEKYELAVSIVSALKKDGVIAKATVNVSDTDDVRLYCVNGNSKIMIYLGSCSDPESRIALAGKVYGSDEVFGKTGYIDIRFSNAYFREGSIYLS